MNRVPFRLLHILLWMLVFASGTALGQDVVRVRGSNALGERVVPVLVGGWMRQIGYGGITVRRNGVGEREIVGTRDGESLVVQVAGTGSGSGFQDLVDGNTDVAMMSRVPTAKELDDGWQLGQLRSPDQEYVVALQALAVVVPAGNPLPAIDRRQLLRILSGQTRDWSELGRKPGRIHLHVADARTGLGQFQAQLLPGVIAADAVRHATAKAIAQAVAADRDAIGIIESGPAPTGTRWLPIAVSGRAIEPSRVNVLTEEYPLVRRLSFYTGQLVTALGRGFVNYAVSDAGQALLASRGFLSLSPASFRAEPPRDAPGEYTQLVAGAQRLSTDLRFGDGIFLFESRSTQDLARMQSYLRRPENRQRAVVLVGLSNRQSTPYMAVSVSNERADLVAQAMSEFGVFPTKVRGVGAVLPVTDDKSESGRNLRVQVWLR